MRVSVSSFARIREKLGVLTERILAYWQAAAVTGVRLLLESVSIPKIAALRRLSTF
jgi:hypothetical protein